MMANLFAIALTGDKRVFQPGDTISGVLLLNTNKEINLRGVRVELHGVGHVRIRSGKVTYARRENYLSFQSILLGRAPFQNGSDVKLQPGNYNFPFQFPLPVSALPTSFEGTYGSVRYWLDAVVERPWRIDLNTRTPLVIVERVQTRNPEFLEPRVKQEDRMLGWPCCPSGQLHTKARIERLAYCPGQEVKISGHVNNESSKTVIGFEAQLVQTVLYKAPEATTRKVTEKLYILKKEQELAPGDQTNVELDSFVIPPVQPTTKGFGCIDISYAIRFKVRVKKAFNTEIIFPIVITTVPPSAEPSVDPVLREHIYIALANYLASRAAAELDSDAQEATEGERNTVWDGSPPPEANRKYSGSFRFI
ncbi:hypothetical protein pdam_00015160 [Pocillopora damicornis]|uniref:Arrestin C-terminal-like domain-containing protein n=1 Tax=Pocillopora damicornis TaxID=46731 RepID=A0A3M6UET8_POCDA|nr:arrestin domain-containing protein 3-like [Pocillopora damicornis]RMX52135.1 hypothetical protein pdam_00015160 [Pocillopora damicornis]